MFEDGQLLVFDKPAGLLAVPGRTIADCLSARVQAVWPDALVVHRLDMATSGLIAFGRGPGAQRALSRAFETRRVAKRYVAVVGGDVAAAHGERGEVDAPLIVDWPNRPRQVVDPVNGKPSLTLWRVLDRGPDRTRLELSPVTGRSHQLRVHCAHLGHPILGDDLYAPPELRDAAPRLLLHACRLELPHPGTGERVVFESAAPF